MHIFYLFGCK